jgi:hypothetical protein
LQSHTERENYRKKIEELVLAIVILVEEGSAITADGTIIPINNDFSINELYSYWRKSTLPVFKDKGQEDKVYLTADHCSQRLSYRGNYGVFGN